MIITTTTSLGIVGALIILACFVANELNKLDRHSLGYDTGNIVGSLLLVTYSYLIGSWPFLILNIVWALVALRDLSKTLAGKEKNR
jgi:hypothetical protein